MGQCNLCKYSSEDKLKESKQTLITSIDESVETKTKQTKVKEIDLVLRINTAGSEITDINTSMINNINNNILPDSLCKHDNIKNYYEISSVILGRGGSSNIYLSRKGGNKFAIKQVIKGGMAKPEELLREAQISLSVNHDHIIKFYEIYEDLNFINFVMELGYYGDLFEFITFSEQGCLSPDISIDILIQIFEAVDYLHTYKNIIHRDLKAENFVLNIDEKNNINIKIIDFGLAIEKQKNGEKINEIIGTRKYQAPEMVMGYEYGEKVDEWALGVVMFSILTGYEPFRRTGEYRLEESILYDRINFEIISDEELRMLNQRLLDRNCYTRISCKEALTFLKNLKFNREAFYNSEYILAQRNIFIEAYKNYINKKFNVYERNTL